MKNFCFAFCIALTICINQAFGSEAGMPQLDPKYWASQAFWLVVIFTLLYFAIAKIFIPVIKNNLDDRDRKIKDCLNDAKQFNELSSIGSYSWGGAFYTTYWIDPQNKLIGIFMSQVRPYDHLSVATEFKNLVYQSIN